MTKKMKKAEITQESASIETEAVKDPGESLTSKQVAVEFNIPNGTLGRWRYQKRLNPRLPRYHKYCTGKVFYVRCEIEADLAAMEINTSEMEMMI